MLTLAHGPHPHAEGLLHHLMHFLLSGSGAAVMVVIALAVVAVASQRRSASRKRAHTATPQTREQRRRDG